jgi:hypothetical protein
MLGLLLYYLFYKLTSPNSYISIESTTNPAVSVLNILGPNVTGTTPDSFALITSSSENPPSGPIKNDILFLLSHFNIDLRVLSFSFQKVLSSNLNP